MKHKPINNTIHQIKDYYNQEDFKKIASSTEFYKHFEDRIWETNSSKKLNKKDLVKGAVKFDFSKDFDFYNSKNLEKEIKKRTELFESIDWKITNQTQYYSAKELYLWEIWLEQVKYIESVFAKNGS